MDARGIPRGEDHRPRGGWHREADVYGQRRDRDGISRGTHPRAVLQLAFGHVRPVVGGVGIGVEAVDHLRQPRLGIYRVGIYHLHLPSLGVWILCYLLASTVVGSARHILKVGVVGGSPSDAVGEDDLQAEHATAAACGRGGRASAVVVYPAEPRDAITVYVPQIGGERLNGPVALEARPVVEDAAVGRELRQRACRILPTDRGYPVACRVLGARAARKRISRRFGRIIPRINAGGYPAVGGVFVGGCVAEEVVHVGRHAAGGDD